MRVGLLPLVLALFSCSSSNEDGQLMYDGYFYDVDEYGYLIEYSPNYVYIDKDCTHLKVRNSVPANTIYRVESNIAYASKDFEEVKQDKLYRLIQWTCTDFYEYSALLADVVTFELPNIIKVSPND